MKNTFLRLWVRPMLVSLLAVLMITGVMPVGLFTPVTAKADGGPVGDTIFNEPYTVPPPLTGAASIDWVKTDHPGYDSRAYTQAASLKYNGIQTPDHVVLNGDDIYFFGYDIPPYADSVFTDLYDVSGISFVLRPIIMNFHTFSEAGFLFNGDFYYVGAKLYYTGYAVILKCGNLAGMQENDPSAYNTASLGLYYIENEEWNPGLFTPGNVTNTRTLISVIKTGISNLDPTPYKVDVDIDAARAFNVYIDGLLRASISASDVKGGASGLVGFGFYTGYYGHSCDILTRIKFENIKFDIDQTEQPTQATVRFADALSGKEIRAPEVLSTGLSGQKYRIVQPLIIDPGIPDFLYVLSHNSRAGDINNDLKLTYQANPPRNTTTLYYTLQHEGDIKEYTEKKARVNGGDWDNGSLDEPVLVSWGDEIEYKITVYKLVGSQMQPGDYGEIRDRIPDGLMIDEASITGVKSNSPIPGAISWKLETSGETTIVWTIPGDMYPVSVSVKTTVSYSQSLLYVNTADVSIGLGSVKTNSTYHEFTYWKISEQFYRYDEVTGPTSDKLPFPDIVTYFRENAPYTVQGLSAEQSRMYIFKGYEYWGTFHSVKSVSDIPELSEILQYEEESGMPIRLYYMPVLVTVYFVDESGAPINAPTFITEMALPYDDYYIRNSNFNSFTFAGKLWNYYDYKLTGPAVGGNKALGAMPVYPGSGPVFNGSVMDGSKHITLYFTDKQAVKVNFKELNNPGNILHNPMIVFFDSSFDPGAAVRPMSSDKLRDDIDLTNANGKIYKYASFYSIGSGSAQAGFPGVCNEPCEITLFFRTTYILTEKFLKDGNTDEQSRKLLDDVIKEITSGGAYNGDPPATIDKAAERWVYMGYKIDNEQNPLNSGFPSIDNVTGDLVIIYIYERKSSLSPFITDHVAYIIGYPEGDVRPSRNVTRAEVATVFFRLLTDDFRKQYWTRDNPYQDVAYSNWFNNAVSVMNKMDIIKGYPGSLFKPNGYITRAELATISARFARIMKMTGNNTVSFIDTGGHWAEADISYAAAIGWVNGYPEGTFRPNQPITRAEFMTLVNKVLGRMPETADDLLANNMVNWPDNSMSAWYYLAVQEATNTHEYTSKSKSVPGLGFNYESWTKITPNRNWQALESLWQNTYT